jgi:hypothetical protein
MPGVKRFGKNFRKGDDQVGDIQMRTFYGISGFSEVMSIENLFDGDGVDLTNSPAGIAQRGVTIESKAKIRSQPSLSIGNGRYRTACRSVCPAA